MVEGFGFRARVSQIRGTLLGSLILRESYDLGVPYFQNQGFWGALLGLLV